MSSLSNTLPLNFNVSVIIPFYKKMNDFRRVLPINAAFFQREGIEIIISLDEPTEAEELLEFIKTYPLINWKIIVNDKDHEWRNPAKALNVGIRHASRKYVMVISPECELYTDVITQLRAAVETDDRSYSVGRVAFADYSFDLEQDDPERLILVYYGSIFAKKSYFEEVNGYTERYRIWGGEDDNIRAKLEAVGIRKIEVGAAILVHREDEEDGYHKRVAKNSSLPREIIDNSFKPDEDDFKDTGLWGTDFNNVRYSYTDGN